ncbi:tyrosine-type recombinase/integrase [Actinomadura alba]|uniref:Tyrosine-type recombinase/integrase n=2 Tax=Actinomadura alba TaxID=406431 RepID=A0ABR7LQY5_9ACTN|nr:tyrosine-type recombinase/integrase [Actinomadura alba]
MGYVRTRLRKDGSPRYTAYFWDVRGRERSAGTFATRKEAVRAWRRAEAGAGEGRFADLRSGRQPFARYVSLVWLANHRMEANTRQGYISVIEKYLLPEFGAIRMIEILPSHVRDFLRRLTDAGKSAMMVQRCKTVLSSIFTTALNDQVIALHPCRGVAVPPVVAKPLTIVSPAEFEAIVEALPDEQSRLLAETALEGGLRWGELTELRLGDLDPVTRMLTVARTVVELRPGYHPSGARFLVKGYPKSREFRRIKLSSTLVARIRAYAAERGLGSDDLLFTAPQSRRPTERRLLELPDPAGATAPNAAGRRYRHGTLSGYSMGRCRCSWCRAAYARYRAVRRAAGKDQPRAGRRLDTDGHIPRDWFRQRIWDPAVQAAGIGRRVRVRDLRHAHASWLLAGGADLQTVRERLGHAGLRATERYLHTLPDADDTALTAFHRTRAGIRILRDVGTSATVK